MGCNFSLPRAEASTNVERTIKDAVKSGKKRLKLRRMNLSEFPSPLWLCKALTELNGDDNRLSVIPSELSELEELEVLRLKGNSLSEVPSSIGDLCKLRKLDVKRNKIERVSSAISKCTALTELDLSHNTLPARALFVNADENLKEDVIIKKDGRHSPSSLSWLDGIASLSTLRLNNNRKLEVLPGSAFENLKCLKVLNLAQCAIKVLPVEFKYLQALQSLDLTNNSITSIPETLSIPVSLIELRLQENSLSGRQALSEKLFLCSKNDVMKLSLLTLSSNNLQQLPASIAQLEFLRELRVSKNNLMELPAAISSLRNLRVLSASHNKLIRLPANLGKNQPLQRLNCANNMLEVIPDTIGSCNTLIELDASCNPKLTKLPKFSSPKNDDTKSDGTDKVKEMNLKLLRVDSCAINELSPDIGNLTNLTMLRVSNNNLPSLPEELSQLTKLDVLELQGNPIPSTTPAIFTLVRSATDLSEENLPVAQEVLPGLFIGGMAAARNIAYLRNAGITHILNLAGLGTKEEVVRRSHSCLASTVEKQGVAAARRLSTNAFVSKKNSKKTKAKDKNSSLPKKFSSAAEKLSPVVSPHPPPLPALPNTVREIKRNEVFKDQFKYLSIDVADAPDQHLLPQLPLCVRFIDDAITGGGSVLCHCHRGVSRSAAVCIAYIMARGDDGIARREGKHSTIDGLPPLGSMKSLNDATVAVKRHRSCCRVNDGFRVQLGFWERALKAAESSSDEIRRNPDRWWSDRNIVMAVAGWDRAALSYAAEELRSDVELLDMIAKAKTNDVSSANWATLRRGKHGSTRFRQNLNK